MLANYSVLLLAVNTVSVNVIWSGGEDQFPFRDSGPYARNQLGVKRLSAYVRQLFFA